MIHKYQILLLGNIKSNATAIIEQLYQSIDDLNLSRNSYKIIRESKFEVEYKGNQPAYVLFFGGAKSNNGFETIGKLLKDGCPILPIYYNSFGREIPTILSNQNGLKFSQNSIPKIVNLILESFGNLRDTRRVFISYKRSQSTSVAIQLFEALEKNNFDVFLDTHSIKQGEPFQDELWHRMTDCDVILLLNTSKFLESEWCEKEIAEASAKKIGVVQLVWPGHKLEEMAELCFPRKLAAADFKDRLHKSKSRAKLVQRVLDEVVATVESVRARNLASRQDSLITNFLNTANDVGKKVSLQPERFIIENLPRKKKRLFVPLIGVPQSMNCERSSQLGQRIDKEIGSKSVRDVVLIYDHFRIREKWLKHLDYLNKYLDVKTLKKEEFRSWLEKH